MKLNPAKASADDADVFAKYKRNRQASVTLDKIVRHCDDMLELALTLRDLQQDTAFDRHNRCDDN